jgi:AcrR family transcriptional regulator
MATKSDVAATIINTALELAQSQGWNKVTLAAIAAQSGLKPDRVFGKFPSKEAILLGFARRIDAEVLKEHLDVDGTVRDRIFDLIMRRFDALTPYRAGIRAILRDTAGDPLAALSGLCAAHRSMSLTLEAAGVSASGPIGRLRANALVILYLRTLYGWLQAADGNDDRIMAELDKALTRAERMATAFAGQRERFEAGRRARRDARRGSGDVDASMTSAAEPNAAGAAEASDQA